MEGLMGNLIGHLKSINFEGPEMFVIAFLAVLAVFRKFSILLVTLLVIVLGWGAQDLIILNITTQKTVMNLPLLIYSAGGVIILVLTLISFYRS